MQSTRFLCIDSFWILEISFWFIIKNRLIWFIVLIKQASILGITFIIQRSFILLFITFIVNIFLFPITHKLLSLLAKNFAPEEEKCKQHKAETTANCDDLRVNQFIFTATVRLLCPNPIVNLVSTWFGEQE